MAADWRIWSKLPAWLSAFLTRQTTRSYGVVIVGLAVVTAVSVALVSRLELKADFIELLPQDYQSVSDLRRIVERVGGFGNLSVAIESADVKASEHFADDLAVILERDFSDRLRYVDYKVDAIKRFHSANAPLFMERGDLETIRDRIATAVTREKRRKIPLFTDLLDDPDDDPPELNFDDITDKYSAKAKSLDKYIDGYYTDSDGRLLAMILKPRGQSTNMPAMTKLIAGLTQAIDTLDPKRYAADMRVSLAGSNKIGLEEYETLKRDILGTALLCASLVALAIFLFFRRVRAVLVLGIACAAPVMWTFAVTYFAIGYLNTVTAFLGAIIAGTGVNYGIILLARYFEERRLGAEPPAALETAIRKTLVATLAAASTTAVAFGVFMFAEVKSFSQFGFIGFVGVLFIWVGSYTLLPALIIASEKIWPSVAARTKGGAGLLSDTVSVAFLARFLPYSRVILAAFGLAAVAGAVAFAFYLPSSLEYDLSRLRTKSSEHSATAKLYKRVSTIFGKSMTPAVLLADSPEQAGAICEALMAKKLEKGDDAGIERCRSIYSFLPDDQEAKLAIVADIRQLLSGTTRKMLRDEQRRQVDDLESHVPDRPLTIADLPAEMTRNFVDTAGNVGNFVYVDPRGGRNLWNAQNLFRFTEDIRRVALADGTEITSSGEAVIFADLLSLMKRDSPAATAASFLAVFLVVVLIFGSLRASIFVAGSLFIGSLLMVGGMAAIDEKMNLFNFVALPMTFGIGVDYAINIYQRYLEEGRGSIEKVLRRTGGAVFLCSLTTIIGYFTLIMADSNALVSLGGLAILGEFTCLGTAMLALPAFITLMERRRAE
jgi:uncharacterized protein